MDALLRRRSMMTAGETPTPPTPSYEPVFHSYLVFDGASGIETGIPIPENSSIRVTLGSETQKKAQGVLGAGNSTVGQVRLYYGGSTNSTNRNIALCYDSTSYIAYRNLAFSSTNYSFFMTPNGYGWGTAFYSYTKGNTHPTTELVVGQSSSSLRYTGRTGTIRIFGSDAAGCQSASAFDNYTPIITLRPCTYGGEAGYWYVEGNRFLGKTLGNGTLTVSD